MRVEQTVDIHMHVLQVLDLKNANAIKWKGVHLQYRLYVY